MATAFSHFKTGLNARRTGSKGKSAGPAKAVSARLDWIDSYRGMAIVAVALIHTSSSCQRLRQSPETAWFCFAGLGRILQFAVPAFLMLSALVLTRSLLRDASLYRYLKNRARTVLWPALIWGLFCVPYVRWLKPGLPWDQAMQLVVSGETDFHLYFLRVLLQLCLLLPFLLPIMRRRPPFWLMLLGTIALTLAILLGNRFYFQVTKPASWVFWYLPPIFLGIWLGTQENRWPEIVRRGWIWGVLATCGAGAVYLPMALANMEGEDVRALLYPLSWWCYSTGAGFLLFCLAFWGCEGNHRWQKALQPSLGALRPLGRYSLQIYLLHPVVLTVLQKQTEQIGGHQYAAPGALAILFASRLSLCLLWPMILAWMTERAKLTGLLFGR